MQDAPGGSQLDGEDASSIYVHCVEFMIMVLGFGKIQPATHLDRIVSIVLMLVAGSLYAYVIGAICSVVSTRDPATAKYQETMDLLKLFTEENRLPPALRARVQGYFRHCRGLFRNRMYRDTLTDTMTHELQREVALATQRTWVERVAFQRALARRARALYHRHRPPPRAARVPS